jgi:hypothetical protein
MSIVSDIDIMVIGFWRKLTRRENLAKFLGQQEKIAVGCDFGV